MKRARTVLKREMSGIKLGCRGANCATGAGINWEERTEERRGPCIPNCNCIVPLNPLSNSHVKVRLPARTPLYQPRGNELVYQGMPGFERRWID